MRARLFAACAIALSAAACGSGSNSIDITSPTAVKCQVTVANALTDNVPAAGLTSAVTVTTTRDCTWTASSKATWLVLGSTSSGQGSGSIEYRVSANGDPVERRGMLEVNNTDLPIVQDAAPCRFTVSPTSTAVSAAGGPFTITIDTLTGCAWTASADASWLTVGSGASGNRAGTVSVTIAANTGGARRGTLTVGGQAVTVDQAAPVPGDTPVPPPAPTPTPTPPPPTPVPCAFGITPTSQNVPAAAGTGTIAVSTTSGCAWTATSNTSWITIDSGGSGSDNGVVRLRFAANGDGARTGTVTVAGKTATIAQAAAPCDYAIGSSSQSIGSDGGNITVQVTAGNSCGWSATSRASWITISRGSSGNGNGSVQLSVAANTGSARAGTVTIAGRTFTVTQAEAPPPPCTISINPTSQNATDTGGPITIAVTASANSCTWTAASNASWITITSGASGSGNGSVGATVAANTGAARTGTLTIGGQTFTVNQAAPPPAPCTFTLAPPSMTIAETGGPGSTAVTASAPTCAWTAASNNPDWITLTSPASGTGNTTVTFTVAANTGAARTGTLTIGGQTMTVNQAAAPPPAPVCTYQVAPPTQAVPAAGGGGAITVTVSDPRCTWTAVSNNTDWLTLTSAASGTGNATVTFSAAPNGGPGRSGTVTISGQVATVTQPAP